MIKKLHPVIHDPACPHLASLEDDATDTVRALMSADTEETLPLLSSLAHIAIVKYYERLDSPCGYDCELDGAILNLANAIMEGTQ